MWWYGYGGLVWYMLLVRYACLVRALRYGTARLVYVLMYGATRLVPVLRYEPYRTVPCCASMAYHTKPAKSVLYQGFWG